MLKSIYTVPKLVKAKEGWYVYFRYNKRKKVFKFDLNKIPDLQEREEKALLLIGTLLKKLKSGWNPFDKTIKKDMLFVDALKLALDKKKSSLAPKTYRSYNSSINFFITAIENLNLQGLEINKTKRLHIRTILDQAKLTRNWSNKAYNKNLNYLSAVLSELIEWDIIEYNPAHRIKHLRETESIANKPANEAEHKKIKECLKSQHPDFYNFIKTIYYTGARPKEILLIQLSMIDLINREIKLPPKITKVGIKHRNIIIDNGLMEVLLSMEISKYPKDFYLFGSFRQRGKGNLGKHLDFIPGTTPIKRDTATKRWQRIVKEGLKIDINMYSYKHKGGNDKLKAGVDLDSIRNQYGHTDKKMTKVYVKEVTGFYKKDIIENSTEF